MLDLGGYLQWAGRQPWAWGSPDGLDCCTFAGKWAICRGWIDPMVVIWSRADRQYQTEIGALRTIRRGGGLVALWTEGMAHVGMPEADDARAGDIAVVEVLTEDGLNQALGIYTGRRWAMRTQAGMFFGPADVFATWRP